MANPLYNNGDYYIGVDGKTYYYQNGKWQQWLFEGAPIGGKIAIPPTGAAAIASGAFVPAAGQEETIKVQSKEQPGGNAANPNGALRYPSDPPIAADADYVCFDFYEYTPPFKNASASDTSGPSGTDAYKQYNAIEYTRSKGLPAGTILLYMPEDISTGYKSNWTGKNFSNIGAGLLKTSGEEGILGKLQSLEQTASGAAQRFTTIAGAQLLSAAIGKITGESIGLDDVFGSTRGVILNPNTELLFTGLDLRNFTLTYKLVPRSAAEATIIEKIIRTFKMCSLPSAEKSEERLRPGDADIGIGLGEGFNAGFIKVPDLVKVTFMNGSNPHEHLPKFKMCALTQVDINYTPDGTYATTRDARMVAYQLTLNFQETKLVYREDVKNGY